MAVTKQWSQCVFRRGESAEDVYWVDAADENAASFASGVPQQNTSNFLDPRLIVQGSPQVRALTPGRLYEVRVFYVRLGGGQQQQNDNPFDKSPIYRWEIGSTSEPVDSDADGHALINSVGDTYTGCTDDFPTLFLTYTRNEGAYDVQKAITVPKQDQ
jgi:hypothetical protein